MSESKAKTSMVFLSLRARSMSPLMNCRADSGMSAMWFENPESSRWRVVRGWAGLQSGVFRSESGTGASRSDLGICPTKHVARRYFTASSRSLTGRTAASETSALGRRMRVSSASCAVTNSDGAFSPFSR